MQRAGHNLGQNGAEATVSFRVIARLTGPWSGLRFNQMTDTQTTPDVNVVVSLRRRRALKDLLAREPQGRHLRVYVEQGGCSGMHTAMFDERRDGDAASEQLGVRWWMLRRHLHGR
jgi:hypothetical protein